MDPFLGEIKMVGFNFAPRGYAMCQGQQMSIAQNNALFALLGTMYGGNGQTTFGLPDYRGRGPVGMGQGPGLSMIVQGEVAGTQSVTLTTPQLPVHVPVAQFTGQASNGALTITADVATTTANPMVPPTQGATTYLSATTAKAGPAAVGFNGLFTNTAPDSTKASLGGLGGQATITPQGTVTIAPIGGSQPFSILNPFLGTNFVIATEGVFPSRN
ncbi:MULTISPECIES: tail fiber protein [unclassified Pseudomonas]|uniref:phage tail protein n=1 Tax=unclassified Pseudomonas TaxID=196821 RepID=UPI002446D676|nr:MULTISPECIES: tail fiber protein [unclassified Pseudomonas]MDG9930466.1 tail fiber protein [Pseudomonas sp. GD04042]MDH0483321.1 tail fiber protein [Pseudomonas sp. GD04015]MDH0606183.1 tail fiber protein [Pseudomonas sp. GD03869]